MLHWLAPTARKTDGFASRALAIACFLVGALSCGFAEGTIAKAEGPVVRVIYLVPADRAIRPDYERVLQQAIADVQVWYRNQMGDGRTFSVPRPAVEVVRTSNPASWYSTNPAGPYELWFWFNVTGEALALTGGRFWDPSNVWLFYIDAEPACGQVTGAAPTVALFPANDLRGLAGEPNIPPCPGAPADMGPVCRWIGGLGHELGHTLGLPHPPTCEDNDPTTPCPSTALLYLGYTHYPVTYLLDEEKAILDQSGFFAPVPLRRTLPVCQKELGCRTLTLPAVAGGTALVSWDGWDPAATGMVVSAGDRLTFSASGTISIYGSEPWKVNGPEGSDFGIAREIQFLLDDTAAPGGEAALVSGAVVGRIGTAPFFYVGRGTKMVAPSAGEISFGVNDIAGYFYDNVGAFQVTVCRR